MNPEEDITEEELKGIYEDAYKGKVLSDDEIDTLVEDFNANE